ncbi:hypothetical protein KCP77_01825 [Salmonella enterica subsp. enterica]|nr:hypothetical protein KCP77_01825 [Salmonella enterica subsp. enterica]
MSSFPENAVPRALFSPISGTCGGITEVKKSAIYARLRQTVQIHRLRRADLPAVALHMETAIPNFAVQ